MNRLRGVTNSILTRGQLDLSAMRIAPEASESWISDLKSKGHCIIRGLTDPKRIIQLGAQIKLPAKVLGRAGTEKSKQLTQALFESNQGAALVRDLYLDNRIAWILSAFHNQSVIDHTKVLVKAANAPETPWHQDHAFFKLFDPFGTMITLWAPFASVSAANGGLRLVKAMPPNELLPHDPAVDGELAVAPSVLQPMLEHGIEEITAEPGDVVLFTSRAVHGTFPNATNHARFAFKLVFQDLSRRAPSQPLRTRAVRFHGVEGFMNRVVPCLGTRLRLQPELWRDNLRAKTRRAK